MDENRMKQMAWVEEIIKMLPVRAQKAFYWAIENNDELEEICDDPDIALEDLPDMMAEAWQEENYALFMLLCISKTLKRSRKMRELI